VISDSGNITTNLTSEPFYFHGTDNRSYSYDLTYEEANKRYQDQLKEPPHLSSIQGYTLTRDVNVRGSNFAISEVKGSSDIKDCRLFMEDSDTYESFLSKCKTLADRHEGCSGFVVNAPTCQKTLEVFHGQYWAVFKAKIDNLEICESAREKGRFWYEKCTGDP